MTSVILSYKFWSDFLNDSGDGKLSFLKSPWQHAAKSLSVVVGLLKAPQKIH